jgi:hypothetical protein
VLTGSNPRRSGHPTLRQGLLPRSFGAAPLHVPKSRRQRRRRSLLALSAGAVALAGLVVWGWWRWSAPTASAQEVKEGVSIQRDKLGGELHIDIHPAGRVTGAEVRLDGNALLPSVNTPNDGTITVALPQLAEGSHELTVRVRRWAYGDVMHKVHFVIDNTPPNLALPTLVDPVPINQPYVLEGKIDKGVTVAVNGAKVQMHDDRFTATFERPPAAAAHVVATDAAGNASTSEVLVPVKYPATHGVHVSSAAWGSEKYRASILALVDAKKIDTVELDVKDESGVVGYDSKVETARRIGAVRADYDLPAAVKELHDHGVRVVGRLVAFRDPLLAKAAWDNNYKDWVIQNGDHQPWAAYGGFTNFANENVRSYNLDLAKEAAAAGMDDILWDYMRRPEGDMTNMVIPGLTGKPADSIVSFLAQSHDALRAMGVYQGASLFGIAATRPDQIAQDVPGIARHVDYIAPMLYPSHWNNGEYKLRNPEKEPQQIVQLALLDFQKKMAGTNRPLVTWIQDFTVTVPYGLPEVQAQISGGANDGVDSWLLWNPNVKYSISG